MMKKLVFAVLVGLLAFPVMAAEEPATLPPAPAQEAEVMPGADAARHEAFQKARKEQMEKMKATREKAEKLVKEYNGLKKGKKKDAKKQEIVQLVASIHEEQLSFKAKQLADFENRLNQMRQAFAVENTPEAKAQWTDKKAEELIENNGDVRVVFGHEKGPRADMKGPRGPKGFDGARKGKGPKGFDGKHKGMLPPPPPPAEEK